MPRFAGDFQGTCTACGEHVEFALGIRTDREPTAVHFGPGGLQSVELRDLELTLLVEDDMHVKFDFICPLCSAWSAGRTRCRGIPEPGEM